MYANVRRGRENDPSHELIDARITALHERRPGTDIYLGLRAPTHRGGLGRPGIIPPCKR